MAPWAKKKFLKLAKGFRGRAKNCYRIMIPRVDRSLQKAYVGRRLRPRTLRTEWIQTISAGVREHDVSYCRFINGLNYSNISLNRKILANLAINEPYTFKAIVDEIKVQKNLQILHKPDMDYIEALERNFLVFDQVKEVPEYDQKRIQYLQIRPSLPQEEKDKIVILHNK